MNVVDNINPTNDHKNITLPRPRIFTLRNGIPLHIINAGSQEVTKIEILVEGGSCDDIKGMTASMMASLLREGSKKYDGETIAENLDFFGAWLNADTMSHCTSISLFSINKYLKNVIEYLTDIIAFPSFPTDKLEILKTRAITNLQTNNEKVSYLASKEFQKRYYGEKHPLGKNVDTKMINSISREDLLDFHKKWYIPENMKIIISGIVTDEAIKIIDNYFGNIQCGGKALTSTSDHPQQNVYSDTILIDKPNAVQSAIKIGIPTIQRSHPDYIPLRILITALGGYFGSRLMQNIREKKGYTYGISSMLLGMRNNSCIGINCQCDNKYTMRVIDEIKNEINKLKSSEIDLEELEQVKSSIICDLLKTTDTPFNIGEYYSAVFSSNIPENYFEKQVETVNSITPYELKEIANKYLNTDNMLTVIAGATELISIENS